MDSVDKIMDVFIRQSITLTYDTRLDFLSLPSYIKMPNIYKMKRNLGYSNFLMKIDIRFPRPYMGFSNEN